MVSLSKQIETVLEKYGLHFNENINLFTGELKIIDNDSYLISVDISPFPISFPIVKEIGGRIPNRIDRHIYKNRVCCLTTEAKEQILIKKRIRSLDNFFALVVIPFFQNNSYYEYNEKYIHGEYEHGIIGVFESYQEIANIKDYKILIELLQARLKDKIFNRDESCFCGSGRKYKRCHFSNYNDLFLIDRELIIKDMNTLINFVKNS